MTGYSKSRHTIYHHRYHIVWITKYRYAVLTHAIKKRVRDLIAQTSEEMNVTIHNGVVSKDHVHMFVEIPPHVTVSEFVKKAKGRSSRKIQQEFPEIKKRYWGRHFWARGYFSATSGNITDEMINEYIDSHVDASKPDSISKIQLE